MGCPYASTLIVNNSNFVQEPKLFPWLKFGLLSSSTCIITAICILIPSKVDSGASLKWIEDGLYPGYCELELAIILVQTAKLLFVVGIVCYIIQNRAKIYNMFQKTKQFHLQLPTWAKDVQPMTIAR